MENGEGGKGGSRQTLQDFLGSDGDLQFYPVFLRILRTVT